MCGAVPDAAGEGGVAVHAAAEVDAGEPPVIVAEVGEEWPDIVGGEAGDISRCFAFPLGRFLHSRELGGGPPKFTTLI